MNTLFTHRRTPVVPACEGPRDLQEAVYDPIVEPSHAREEPLEAIQRLTIRQEVRAALVAKALRCVKRARAALVYLSLAVHTKERLEAPASGPGVLHDGLSVMT